MGYECLIAGLPDIHQGGEAPLTMVALLALLDETLTDNDKKLLKAIRMQPDDSSIDELMAHYDDSILNSPDWYEDAKSLLSEADLRTQLVYEEGKHTHNTFVRKWFEFNQDMNNVLVATICRKHGFDVKRVIVGHNEVAEVLRKGLPQKDFGLAGILPNLSEIVSLVEIENLMEREKRMDALRFEWLEENTLFIHFSIENVLAYYLQAEMLNRWSLLTVEHGEEVFRELVASMKKGIDLSNA